MYLLMARLRRMARPLRYRIVNTKTENKAKRMAITPSTMAVVACLKTKEEDERMSHCLHLILNQTIWNTAEQLTQKCNGMTQHSLQFLDRSTYTQNTGRGEFEINTNIHTNIQSSSYRLPLGTVDVARFTASFLVGVFKDDFLPSHHALRTRGDTMWTVLHAGTYYTLISSLKRKTVMIQSQWQYGVELYIYTVMPLGGSSTPKE